MAANSQADLSAGEVRFENGHVPKIIAAQAQRIKKFCLDKRNRPAGFCIDKSQQKGLRSQSLRRQAGMGQADAQQECCPPD